MGATFTITKIEFKKLLSGFKISEKNIDMLITQMDKSYKHMNALAFAEQLQKLGLKQNEISNVFRRLGIDDITISNLFDILEEDRIRSTFGRLVDLNLE